MAVAPDDAGTQDVVRQFAPYTQWLFDLDDVGDIQVHLHGEAAPNRPIRETFDQWLEASQGDGDHALRDRRAHETLTRVLLADGRFRVPPVIRSQPTLLGPKKWITDGAHRFLAAFDLGRAGQLRDGFEMLVFWGQNV